jgi:hypothetical protein
MILEETDPTAVETGWVLKCPILLLVEGKDDKAFFEALINHEFDSGVLQRIQVIILKDNTKWKRKLKIISGRPEFKDIVSSLGLVRDADDDPTTTFQSVCDALNDNGLPVPKNPVVSVGDRPKVSVLILPKENESGELEDLCLESVKDDPAVPHVEQYFRYLDDAKLSLPNKLCKPKVQVFLASRPRIIDGLRMAAKAGCWPWENEAFRHVKIFLHQIID